VQAAGDEFKGRVRAGRAGPDFTIRSAIPSTPRAEAFRLSFFAPWLGMVELLLPGLVHTLANDDPDLLGAY